MKPKKQTPKPHHKKKPKPKTDTNSAVKLAVFIMAACAIVVGSSIGIGIGRLHDLALNHKATIAAASDFEDGDVPQHSPVSLPAPPVPKHAHRNPSPSSIETDRINRQMLEQHSGGE